MKCSQYMPMRSLGTLRRRAARAHLIQQTAEGLVTKLGTRVHHAESLAMTFLVLPSAAESAWMTTAGAVEYVPLVEDCS